MLILSTHDRIDLYKYRKFQNIETESEFIFNSGVVTIKKLIFLSRKITLNFKNI